MRIVVEDRNVCNIPILDVYELDVKEKRPIIIMLHGANGSKEKYIERAYEFVKRVPIWQNFVRRYISKLPTEALSFNEDDIIQIEKYIESIEPLNHTENMKDLPLLMLNGKKDELIPINSIRQSYCKLQNNYKDQQLIKSIEFEGIGHTVTPQMLEVACEWIKKYI
ncbi:MAG: hypothetical protein ACREV6_01540 [Clostridium sp.]|uniref:hypothetical protein n=1 Tax=Clostridium sp. TaxID=1506 RepID=UPI003D6CA213